MKTPTAQIYITVGKIGVTYGVQGWLKIHTYTETAANILNYQPWYLSDDQVHWDQAEVENSRNHGNGVIVKLAGYQTPEKARLLTGKLIAITRSQLPKLNENEYYWSDLIGLTVINKSGSILGKVIHLMETGANDVLIIKGDKEHAMPYLPGKVVLSVDLANGKLYVDWDLI